MNRTMLIAAAGVGLMAGVAQAVPTITLIPEYVASRTSGGTLLTGGNAVNMQTGQNNDPTHRHRFNVLLRLDGALAGEDWRATTFSVSLGSGLSKASTNWAPAAGTFEPDPVNDPGTMANLFTNNTDGATANDLQAIFVANTDSVIADSRQYGETPRPESGGSDPLGYPTRLGHFEVNWDGTGPTEITFTFTGAAGSVFLANSNGAGTPLTEGVLTFSETFVIGSQIPEPTSISLLALGGAGLIRRRRA